MKGTGMAVTARLPTIIAGTAIAATIGITTTIASKGSHGRTDDALLSGNG